MHGCIDRARQTGSHLLGAVGQPEDEMLDGHGAVRAPTNAYGGLKHQTHILVSYHSRRVRARIWKGSGSVVPAANLGHHRHEHLRGGRYPLLQERLQDRVVQYKN